MATYTELFALQNDSSLLNRTAIALSDIAMDINAEAGGTTNHANRLLWAKSILQDPLTKAPAYLRTALITNKGLTPAAIQAATDAGLKTALAAIVDLFATGNGA